MTFNEVDIVGTGNVASHLIRAFQKSGVKVSCVYARDAAKAADAATIVNARSNTIDEADHDGPLMIVAVSDDTIAAVSSLLPQNRKVVHTSGSASIDVIAQAQRGVFYPLQTFTREVTPDWKQIPFCIEAADEEMAAALVDLAGKLSDSVQKISSEQRRYLHVAAVIANNFTNHLYAEASAYLEAHNLSLDLLRPLISETARKVQSSDPKDVQTGPAKRHDTKTINEHLELLQNNPGLRDLYVALTERILKSHS